MQYNKVHIIGIGGISMSGIAKILLKKNIKVSGSDIEDSKILDDLRDLGAEIFIGHEDSNIKDVDVVVYTNAVNEDNVELQTARSNNLKILKRAQFIAELFKDKKTIAVTGTHGKTTTTSMLTSIFVNTNLDPTVMIGGNLDIIDGNIKTGQGEYFITEADESDGSLTYFDPRYAVITNIEWDHFNYYKNKNDLLKKFKEFIDNISPQGALVLGGKILEEYPKLRDINKNIYTYGFEDEYFTAKNIHLRSFKSNFDLFIEGIKVQRITLNVPGRHNVLNALAAYAISYLNDIKPEVILEGLEKYKGVKRRFEKKGYYNRALIIDDYAHHPTEIISTIETARRVGCQKLYVVFQPHRYSRTKNLLKEFSESFDDVDVLILTDIYSASEKPIEGIDSERLYKLIKKHKNNNNLEIDLKYISKFDKISKYLSKNLLPGDLLITIGAGDVYQIGEKLVGE